MSVFTTSASTTFVDLATYCELERFLYGGCEAITWFVASVQKCNWFSFIPITLRQEGIMDFGARNSSATLNRSGDYVLNVWFRAVIPQIQLVQNTAGTIFQDATIRWTRYIMHNLFEEISITFNELTVQSFDNFWLDVNFQFRVRGSKRQGYRNMVGDIASMTSPVALGTGTPGGLGVPLGTGGAFSVVLPFWFGEDSGLALPVAGLPFNEVKINYIFRHWQDLLVIFSGSTAGTVPATVANVFIVGTSSGGTGKPPMLMDAQTWAHYAVIHTDERIKMGDCPRDILIYQVQETQPHSINDLAGANRFDLRFSYAIVALFFMARNTATTGEWSNYTTEPDYAGLDPISHATLQYENQTRVSAGSDYYALTVPYLFSDAIPDETGYHMYAYGIHPWDPTRPSGSTNYTKLANVSWIFLMSTAAQNAANATFPTDQFGIEITTVNSAGDTIPFPQKWDAINLSKNLNIVRTVRGSLGQPIL